jgi:hypothetical protein
MGSLIFGLLRALGALPVVPMLIVGGFSIAGAGPSRNDLMGELIGELGLFVDLEAPAE